MAKSKTTAKLTIKVVYEPAPDAGARLFRCVSLLLNQQNKNAKTTAQEEKANGG